MSATVTYVDRLDLAFSSSASWAFSTQRRAEIDAHFEQAKRKQPLWNGRVLMMHQSGISGSVFHGALLESDFASLLAWRDWGFPDRAIRNCFAQAALRGSDGGFVMGVMSAHTANAGQVYFPSGTPDPSDIIGDRVDLDASVARELLEETGLIAADFTLDPGWFVVQREPAVAMMKIMQASEPAEALRGRIRAWLETQKEPELADIVIVHGPDDLDPRARDYAVAFLRHIWRA
jgi:8-oxo-dGTP pyrophosphatase MutT (NUDIX family)